MGWSDKEAEKAYNRAYYLKNKEKADIRNNANRVKRLEIDPDYERKYYHRKAAENPAALIYKKVKDRARRNNIPFDLDPEDIVIPERCPYLGIELYRNTGGVSGSANSPSVDRIVPELGYVKGNVQVISHLANSMKQNASVEQLLTFADSVKRIHG